MSPRTCPQCHVAMTPRTISVFEIDLCPQCEGMFFDFEELLLAREQLDEITKFQKLQEGDDKKDHETHRYLCPNCKTEMKEIEYQYDSGIHIDQCQGCHGIYLEKEELLQINNYLDSEQSPEVQDRVARGQRIAKQFERQLEADEKKRNTEQSVVLPAPLHNTMYYLIDKIM